MFSFGEIRAFTPAEVGRMSSELDRVRSVVMRKQMDLSNVTANPLNYVLETQRAAISRLQEDLRQSEKIRDQLRDSLTSTVESGDTAKLEAWLRLAAVVGRPDDFAIWNEQVKYAQTSETVGTVASETARDAGQIGGAALTLVIVGGGLYVLGKILGGRNG